MIIANDLVKTGLLLGGFTLIGSGLLATMYNLTADRIAESRKQALTNTLTSALSIDSFDNALTENSLQVTNPLLGTEASIIYRATLQKKPVAAMIQATAPDGYNGDIKVLTALDQDASVIGVRVIQHTETPGLGDAVEVNKSDWIHQFYGKSHSSGFALSSEGGSIDKLTGATITSRAVVNSVNRSIEYYQKSEQLIWQRIESNL